jgi:hypothetical protein
MEGTMEKSAKKAAPRKSSAATTTPKPRAAAKPRQAATRANKAPLAQVFELNHETIAERAYDLFERSGHPHGRDIEFWLEAERELQVRRKA